MRDIVSASYNHTSKPTTLNKHDYKSYKDFLDNYSDNKNCKDEVESISSNDSGISSSKLLESKSNNTSTSSLDSDGCSAVFSKREASPTAFAGGNRTGSFRNYLDTYSNKKFSSVKPKVVASKPSATMKSELVIQVSDRTDSPNGFVAQRPPLSLNIKQQDRLSPALPPFHQVLTQQIRLAQRNSATPPPLIQQAANTPPPQPSPIIQQTSTTPPPPPPPCNQQTSNTPPPPPPPPFNQQTSNAPPPPPPPPMTGLMPSNNLNHSKKWATIETETCQTHSEQPKIQKSNVAAANLAKILNEHVLARRKISDTETPNLLTNGESCPNATRKASTLPRQVQKTEKPIQNTKPATPMLPRTPPKIDTVDYCTTTVVPVTDASATVNKSDPNVKKLVYNTYRGLLGAYNNKANDMISTLPRNMVTQDKGVAKQVESISLQCRLEKLNGRINRKIEQE